VRYVIALGYGFAKFFAICEAAVWGAGAAFVAVEKLLKAMRCQLPTKRNVIAE
jgi:hypothetical protein